MDRGSLVWWWNSDLGGLYGLDCADYFQVWRLVGDTDVCPYVAGKRNLSMIIMSCTLIIYGACDF